MKWWERKRRTTTHDIAVARRMRKFWDDYLRRAEAARKKAIKSHDEKKGEGQ